MGRVLAALPGKLLRGTRSRATGKVAVFLGQTSWADKVGGPAAGIFLCQFKCLTVIHLIRGCAVTTCDFHDALLERWTGGIDRLASKAKQRLVRRQRRQRRASP